MHTIERISLGGACNTRDLGGFPAAEGHVVRARRLIRSGELSGLTQRDKQVLVEGYALRQVIDFRTEVERSEKPELEMAGVHAVWNPILDGATLGITRETSGGMSTLMASLEQMLKAGLTLESYMDGVYLNLVTHPGAQGQYARFFDLLLEQRDGATLWHCSAGKDRVGVGTALLLSALGVDRALIVRDYMMTEVFTAEETAHVLRNAPPHVREVVRGAFGVRERYIMSVFDAIESGYGSVEAYLNDALGLSKSRTLALRSLYLT